MGIEHDIELLLKQHGHACPHCGRTLTRNDLIEVEIPTQYECEQRLIGYCCPDCEYRFVATEDDTDE